MSAKARESQKRRWANMLPKQRAAFIAYREQKRREAVAKIKGDKR